MSKTFWQVISSFTVLAALIILIIASGDTCVNATDVYYESVTAVELGDEHQLPSIPPLLPLKVAKPSQSMNCIAEPEPEVKNHDKYSDVPLPEGVIAHVVSLCDDYDVDPDIIFAMIWRESRYVSDNIGDNGCSFGLMQIQKRFHGDRMKALGCDDLLDPYQNVEVGINYLAELVGWGNGLEWALTAYNRGWSRANKSNGKSGYADDVFAMAETFKDNNLINAKE